MKVLLFEQWSGGHYANYMNCLVPELARLCDKLVIAVGERMRNSHAAQDIWAAHPNVEFALKLPEVPPGLNARDRYAAARNLVTCLRSVRPDFTILPSADAQSTGLAALKVLGFNVAKHFGLIEGTLHYGYGYSATNRKDRLKELVYSQTFARVPYASLNFVNFAYYEYAIASGLVEPERIRFVGDPVPQASGIGQYAARQRLGLDTQGRYVGLLGSLDSRKAIPELLGAFRAAMLKPDDRLLLAGRLDPTYSALIAAQYDDLVRAGRIVVLDRFLTDDELKCGYEALDLAAVVYYKFPGLASLALKAVAAGTPIIAHDFGWLRAAIRRFDIGTITNVFETSIFALALSAALDRQHGHTQSEAVRRLLAFHTEKSFVTHMTKGLRLANGALEQTAPTWNWVMEAVPHERRWLV